MRKIIISITIVLSSIAFVGYMLNKHIKTVTDYSNNGVSKTIWVSDLSSVKTIPNYSKKEGFELVLKSDYEKYKQGYCLDEDGILSDEEIYRRAITQYLEKKVILYNKINIYRYGKSPVRENKPVGYYLLNGIDADNWYEKFSAKYDKNKKRPLETILFEEFNATAITNFRDFLTIDLSKMTAGFKKPIIYSDGDGGWELVLNQSFILEEKNRFVVGYNMIHLIEGYDRSKYAMKDYKKTLKNRKVYPYKIDNCGNIDYDIEKYYLKYRESTGG